MIKEVFSKILVVDYDLVSCMNHENQKGGSALEGLSTDSELTLGLDNRGETHGLVGIGLLIALIIFGAGVSIIKIIPDPAVANIGLIAVLGSCLVVIIGFGYLSLKLRQSIL